MGFQVLHLRAARAEDDSLLVDNGHPYHMGELNGKQKVRRLARVEKLLHL